MSYLKIKHFEPLPCLQNWTYENKIDWGAPLMFYISFWLLLVSVINIQPRSDFVIGTFFLYTLYKLTNIISIQFWIQQVTHCNINTISNSILKIKTLEAHYITIVWFKIGKDRSLFIFYCSNEYLLFHIMIWNTIWSLKCGTYSWKKAQCSVNLVVLPNVSQDSEIRSFSKSKKCIALPLFESQKTF